MISIDRFLVNMHYAFQDRENLYVVIDIMPGGDLRYHFAKHRKFTEEQTSMSHSPPSCHI
jgi:serine/threonine protein kinase